jgi:uncharacterized membrane protein YeaQ/YmgE (transglycosylase-associated protein family)
MGTPIPSGTYFNATMEFNPVLLMSSDQVLANMSPYLQNSGLGVVSDSLSSTGILHSISLGLFGAVNANLQLQANSDTDTDTVRSAINQAYNLVTKDYPLSVSIPTIGNQSTGEQVPSNTSSCSDPNVDFFTNLFCQIKSGGTAILVGLVGVIVLVLILVAYGPNVKHVAAAL